MAAATLCTEACEGAQRGRRKRFENKKNPAFVNGSKMEEDRNENLKLIIPPPPLMYNTVLGLSSDGFLEDFCCGTKSKLFREPSPPSSSCGLSQSDWSSSEPPYRTDSQPGYGDPGGGGAPGTDATARLHPLQTKSVLELKQPSSTSSTSSLLQGNRSPFASTGAQTHYQVSHHHHHHLTSQQPQYPPPSPPSHPDTDSALEAAVNSILEC